MATNKALARINKTYREGSRRRQISDAWKENIRATLGSRRQMTLQWKENLRAALKRNEAEGRTPANQAELAKAIGVHKTAINKLFDADSSALVGPICETLGLGPPMTPSEPSDDVTSEIFAEISKLGVKDRAKVLKLLKFVREFLL